MKRKTMKRLLAFIIAAASVMSAPGLIVANAAGTQVNKTATVMQESTDSAAVQPMEANGILSEEGDTAQVVSDEAEVSFGVVSDTHVTQSKETEKSRLAKAAKFFSSAGLDRMVVAGDLTDSGASKEYEAWGSVIKENLTIPLIASMGNHENNSANEFIKTTGNKPNNHQVVNGYHFITLSPGSGTLDSETGKGATQGGGNYTYAVKWLEEQLAVAEEDTPDKPIFVFFHHPIKNTFYVSSEWYGSGLDEVFKSHPHAVTFSGHIHSPNNMPTSIWQDGGYTAVNTVTLSYMEMESGMIYGSVPPNKSQIAQGLVIEASGSKVTIKNYDFLADKWIPQTWTFDVNDTLPYTEKRSESATAPYFDEDAKLTVSDVGENSAKLTFDQATVSDNNVGDIVHSYKYDIINSTSQKVVKTFKTWSNYYLQPMPEQMTQTAPDLDGGTSYEVRIYAIDAYQKVSENYLSQTFRTTGESVSEPDFDDMVSGIPKADLLDVDFSDGIISDHSESANTFYGSDGSNITKDESLNKYVATFTGKADEAFLTDWSTAQYEKTNDDFTMECTFKVDSFNGSYVDLFSNMESAGIGFEISPYDEESASLEAWAHIGGAYKCPIATGALKYGEWNHAAITYDKSKVTLYLNGQKIASKEASGNVKTPASSSRYYVIGGDSGKNGSVQSPMVGAISTARLYSKALTQKQIGMLANRELPAIDTTKPVIRVETEPSASGYLGTEYSVPAAQAADNSTIATVTVSVKDPEGKEIMTIGGNSSKTEVQKFQPAKTGNYQLMYMAADPSGNATTLEYTIQISAADQTKLKEEIAKASAISPDELAGYTEASKKILTEALQKALEINDASTQAEVDTITKELKDAIAGLEKQPEVQPVDKTKLQDLYNEIKDLTVDGYTSDSFQTLNTARTNALEILSSNDADQTAVDTAYEELKGAVEKLQTSQVQTYIKEVMAFLDSINTTNVPEEIIAKVNEVAAELEKLNADTTVKDNQKAAKAVELIWETSNLTPDVPNISGLDLALRVKATLNQEAYTESSWKMLEDAFQNAKSLLDELQQQSMEVQTLDSGVEFSEEVEKVNASLETMKDSITALEEKVVELIETLRVLVTKADEILANSDLYTPNSLNGLSQAKDTGKALIDANSEDIAEINRVQTLLEELLKQVQLRADKTSLILVLSKASLIKQTEYTTESLTVFTEEYEAAKAIYEDLNISDQKIVDTAASTLEQAMKALVKKQEINGDNENNGNNGNNGNNNNNGNHGNNNSGEKNESNTSKTPTTADTNTAVKTVKTGDDTSPFLMVITLFAGIAGIAIAVRQKKKIR